ncbi:dephospho-CoA kinase [bacterium]|nr:dephospho-CoA kinase [bacterium]
MILALTGALHAGKSTVATLLVERGFFSWSADDVVHDLLGNEGTVQESVIHAFPDGVVEGVPCRELLAKAVFRNAQDRERLEGILHPPLKRLLLLALEEGRDRGGNSFFEIPLLVESRMAPHFDAVLTVEAPLHLRLNRALSLGMNQEEFLLRDKAQSSVEERIALSDGVITNDSRLEDLNKKLSVALASL